MPTPICTPSGSLSCADSSASTRSVVKGGELLGLRLTGKDGKPRTSIRARFVLTCFKILGFPAVQHRAAHEGTCEIPPAVPLHLRTRPRQAWAEQVEVSPSTALQLDLGLPNRFGDHGNLHGSVDLATARCLSTEMRSCNHSWCRDVSYWVHWCCLRSTCGGRVPD